MRFDGERRNLWHVPGAVDDSAPESAKNYAQDMDRRMLYIAGTRAMHELHLTHDGPLSRFVEFTKEPKSGLGVVGAETAEIRDRAADVRVG